MICPVERATTLSSLTGLPHLKKKRGWWQLECQIKLPTDTSTFTLYISLSFPTRLCLKVKSQHYLFLEKITCLNKKLIKWLVVQYISSAYQVVPMCGNDEFIIFKNLKQISYLILQEMQKGTGKWNVLIFKDCKYHHHRF